MVAKKRRRKAGRRSALPLIAGLAAAVGIALVGLQFLPQKGPKPAEELRTVPTRESDGEQAKPRARPRPRAQPPASEPERPTRTTVEPERARETLPRVDRRAGIPKIALVIDDCGYNQDLARRFARVQVPLTFAVIPYLDGSEACAEDAFKRGHEVILHQPMEPESYPETKVEEGALLLGMGGRQVASTLTENLGTIPHVSGLNNHMGSAATADRSLMGHVMASLNDLRPSYPGLYFLDSKTSAGTVAYDTARRRGIPTAMRSVFLDHDESLASVTSKLDELLEVAEEEGEAIGIGHVKPDTLAAIEALLTRLGPDEFDFVFASELAR